MRHFRETPIEPIEHEFQERSWCAKRDPLPVSDVPNASDDYVQNAQSEIESDYVEIITELFLYLRQSGQHLACKICSQVESRHNRLVTHHVNMGFSPLLVAVPSTSPHPSKKSFCAITRVNRPVTALYTSSTTAKSVGNNMSKNPCMT